MDIPSTKLDLTEMQFVTHHGVVGLAGTSAPRKLEPLDKKIDPSNVSLEELAGFLPKLGEMYLVEEKGDELAPMLLAASRFLAPNTDSLVIFRNAVPLYSVLSGGGVIPVQMTANQYPDSKCLSLDPTAIVRVAAMVESELKKPCGSVFLGAGAIEYLITQNNYGTVLNLLQLLKDKVMLSPARMILQIDPRALKEDKLTNIEKECAVIKYLCGNKD